MRQRIGHKSPNPRNTISDAVLERHKRAIETHLDGKIAEIDKKRCGILVKILSSGKSSKEEKLEALKQIKLTLVALNYNELELMARVLNNLKRLDCNRDAGILKAIEETITAAETLAVNIGGVHTLYDRTQSLI